MTSSSQSHSRSRIGWILLRIVLLVETLLGVVVVVNTFAAFFAASSDPLGARLSILIAVLISWAWVLVTLVAAWRGRGWARGSALTLHVLLFAVAAGVLQGIFGDLFLTGALLLVLSFAGFFGALVARPSQTPAEG